MKKIYTFMFAWLMFSFVVLQGSVARSEPVRGLSLVWPISPENRQNLGNDYGQYNYVTVNEHHTGLDISESVGTVQAAAPGEIVKIQENDVGCNPNIAGACEDHGYGTTVVIRHMLGSVVVYSQYSHMASVLSSLKTECGPIDAGRRKRRTCTIPVTISAGDALGTVGCTRYGLSTCNASFGSHLHFEVKNFSTLGTIGDDAGEFGYTPLEPDVYGYTDPVLNLHQVTPLAEIPVRVTSLGQGALMIGPGNYRDLGTVSLGEEFVAIGTSSATLNPACSAGWYQIQPTTMSQDTQTVNGQLYFDDPSRPRNGTPSGIPEAWVCKGNGNESWVEEVGSTATCHLFGASDLVPEGFGAAYDVFSPNHLLLRVACGDSVQFEVVNRGTPTNSFQLTWGGNSNVFGGYKWMWNDPSDKSKGGSWFRLTFSGGTPVKDSQGNESGWRVGTMSTTISPSLIQSGTNYVVAYVCTWTGMQWKCGCRDSDCTQNLWQLQAWQEPVNR